MRVTVQTLQTVLALFLFVVTGFAGAAPWFSKGENNQIKLDLDLYISTTCPHCQKEEVFLRDLQKQKPWLEIHRYEINKNRAALEHFHQQLYQQYLDDYSVPALFFCDSRWVGFDTEKTTGQTISRALDYCYQQISKKGYLNQETKSFLNQWSASSAISSNLVNKPASQFIPLVALSDALSSCSLFVVLALFAFLWLYKERSLMVGYGILYIFIVLLVHYSQQFHAAFFYQALPWLRIVSVLVGLGLIAYAYIIYCKGSNIRPGLALSGLIGSTALIVMSYQQTCLPNFALVFSQWLDLQPFSFLHRGFLILLYNLLYLLPLTLILLLIIYFRIYKRIEKSRRLLVCFAWCLLMVIGLIAIIYPQGFSNFLLSLAALVVSLIVARVILRKSVSLNGDSYFGEGHE